RISHESEQVREEIAARVDATARERQRRIEDGDCVREASALHMRPRDVARALARFEAAAGDEQVPEPRLGGGWQVLRDTFGPRMARRLGHVRKEWTGGERTQQVASVHRHEARCYQGAH